MKTEYDAILGIAVTYGAGRGSPISALLVGHSELSINQEAVGFDINNNGEANIKLLKPIDKSLEELMDGYQVSGRCDRLESLRDQLDNLHWLGYAYVMKNYPDHLPGKPPLLIVTSTQFIDTNIWKEISTESFIQEINDRTNVVGENK